MIIEICYAYEDNICLIYGIPCRATNKYKCYHTEEEQAYEKGLLPRRQKRIFVDDTQRIKYEII